jgi:hypothetical protein
VLSQGKKGDYDDIVTMGLPLSNDGKPVPSEALHTGGGHRQLGSCRLTESAIG